MPITTNNRHDKHQVRIHLCKGLGPHYAALRCVECNKHIQWLSSGETNMLTGIGIEVRKYYKTETKDFYQE